jgi:hypothetical protein
MKRYIRNTILMLPLLIWHWTSLLAQEGRFQLNVNAPEEVEAGEAFQVVFELNRVADHFEGPETKGLEILGRPGYAESRQIALVNGKQISTVSVTYTYAMKALKPGKAEIGSALVKIGRQTFRTKPFTIEVKGKTPEPASQWADPGEASGDIFIANLITNKNPYKGEVIVLTQKLYTRLSINNIGRLKMPAFQGFWSESIDIGNYQVVQETYQGKLYNTLILSRTVLIPQRTGKVVVEPSSVTIQRVVERTVNRQLWGGVMQQRVREVVDNEIKSNSIILDIKELPASGMPENYRGSVGNYSLEAELSSSTSRVGEPVELRIRISGTGNIKLLDEPEVQLPTGLDLYDPEVTGKINVTTAGMSGSREYTFLVIPRDTGEFIIPGIGFSYFDPATKRYINRVSGVMRLSVAPAARGQLAGLPGSEKSNVEYFGKDIRFLSLSYAASPVANVHPGGLIHILGLLIPLVVLIIILTIYRKHVRLRADTRRLRFSRALTLARSRIRDANKARESGDSKVFFDLILDALWGYASDKLNLHASELSKGRLREALSASGATEEQTSQFLNMIEGCEFSRYAPVSEFSDLETLSETADEVIRQLEQVFRMNHIGTSNRNLNRS